MDYPVAQLIIDSYSPGLRLFLLFSSEMKVHYQQNELTRDLPGTEGSCSATKQRLGNRQAGKRD